MSDETPAFEFTFEEVATTVEQRWRRVYHAKSISEAKAESQVEFENVSTGWWLVLKRLGLAIWISHEKPAIESGDLLEIRLRKRER
jgi:hypothetical protein